MVRRTKQDVIDDITALVAAGSLSVSRGSTEPKAVFDAVNFRLGLGLDPSFTKPEYAEAIARAAGLGWDKTCDSRHTDSGGGSTVTITGLERVLAATELIVARTRARAPSLGDLPPECTLEEETHAILQILDQELPRYVDGRTAVEELRSVDYQWRQIEWPGFYFEYLAREGLRARLGGDVGPRFGNTEFDYRLIRVFDIKVHSVGSSSSFWLNDAEAIETAILKTGGVGFITVSGLATPDDGSFREWHQALKGGPSAYSCEARERGAPSRPRKSAFERTAIEVFHLDGMDSLRAGLENGWLQLRGQGRQAGGGDRRPKYQLSPKRVPGRYRYTLPT